MRIYSTKYIFFTFIFAYFEQNVTYASNEYNNFEHEHMHIHNLTTTNEKLTKWTSNKSGFIVSNILGYVSSANISYQCKESLIMYVNNIMKLEPWALEMLDASGKPPSSMIVGSMTDFGNYEECLRIRVPSDDESTLSFKGQYCMVHLRHPLFQPSIYKTEDERGYFEAWGTPPDWINDFVVDKVSIRFGLYLGTCIPSVCTEEDLFNIINGITETAAVNVTITDCAVESESSPEPWPLTAKFAAVVVSSLSILCVIGTWLDLMDRKQSEEYKETDENTSREMLKSFSVYRNTMKAFKTDSKKHVIDCIHGIRGLFCVWIIVAHLPFYYTFWVEMYKTNQHQLRELNKPELIMVFMNNGLISVEAFFFITGFLVMYFMWKALEKTDGNISMWPILFVRYCRMTFAHLFIVILTFLLPFINYGPVWQSSWQFETNKCFTNGWKNILYIHNLDDSAATTMCWLHTWFIGVTMQCALIFTPIVIFTYKYPKFGTFICLTILIWSIVHCYVLCVEHSCQFVAYNGGRIPQRVLEFVDGMYGRPIFHFPSNLIGMLSGWICAKYRNPKLSKVWLITGWFFCLLSFAFSLYFPYAPISNVEIESMYNTLRNTFYCLGFSWVMFTCTTGYGGVVDKVLTWKGWRPISQMSYSLYLVHPLFLVLRHASLTERTYLDKISLTIEELPYVLIAFVFGFVVYVTVEEPFNRILDLLIKERLTSMMQKPSASVGPPTLEKDGKFCSKNTLNESLQ